jgi:hypothetical protein
MNWVKHFYVPTLFLFDWNIMDVICYYKGDNWEKCLFLPSNINEHKQCSQHLQEFVPITDLCLIVANYLLGEIK